jgi:RHS repeat-associated protein
LEEQPVTWGSQYKFLGNEDDGGLMDFGARFYDPLVGRFTSPDPIKDVSSANAVNPYVYCSNNPLRYTDKHGLSKEGPNMNVGADDGGGRGDPTYHLLWDPFTGYLNFVPTADYHNICVFRHCSFEVEMAVQDQKQFIKDCEADYNKLLANNNFNKVLQTEKAKQEAAERRLRAALFGDVSEVSGIIFYEIDVPGSAGDKVYGQAESDKIIREGAEQGKKIMALGFYSEFAEFMMAVYRDALVAGGASVKKGAIIGHTRGLTFDGTLTGEPVPYTQKFGSLNTGFWQDAMVKVSNPAGADWNVVGCYLGYVFTEVLSVYQPHINVIEATSTMPGGCRVSTRSGWQEIRQNFLGY